MGGEGEEGLVLMAGTMLLMSAEEQSWFPFPLLLNECSVKVLPSWFMNTCGYSTRVGPQPSFLL